MEDLEQIFLRSWRESHLPETRQPQPFPPAPGAGAQVTSAQLPWLAGLAASSCNDSVHIIECAHSLAEGLSEMFRLLVEGKLAQTNYVVIIRACRSAAIDSCIAVTGEPQSRHQGVRTLLRGGGAQWRLLSVFQENTKPGSFPSASSPQRSTRKKSITPCLRGKWTPWGPSLAPSAQVGS